MKKYYKKNNDNINISVNFIPIGAFLIYTKKWILNEKIAFPSDTFMYLEEDFLYIYLLKKNYKIIYSNVLKVRHLEGRSVDSKSNNKYKNLAFKYKNQILATEKYIKFTKDMKGKNYEYKSY